MQEKRSTYLALRISLGEDVYRPAHNLDRGHKEKNRHNSRNQGTSGSHDCRRNHCKRISSIDHGRSNDHSVVGEYQDPKDNQKHPMGDSQFPGVFPSSHPLEQLVNHMPENKEAQEEGKEVKDQVDDRESNNAQRDLGIAEHQQDTDDVGNANTILPLAHCCIFW